MISHPCRERISILGFQVVSYHSSLCGHGYTGLNSCVVVVKGVVTTAVITIISSDKGVMEEIAIFIQPIKMCCDLNTQLCFFVTTLNHCTMKQK